MNLIKQKHLFVKLILSLLIILSGNFFLYALILSLTAFHLLTTSTIQIVISLVIPITLFTFYLTLTIIGSIFIKNRLIWLFILLISVIDYPFLIGPGVISTLGEIVITLSMFLYLVNFYRYDVLVNHKTSLVDTEGSAFTLTSFIISIVLVINFYSIYSRSLTSNNTILSNQTLVKNLSPIVKVYTDDLKVKNYEEKFGSYLKREASSSGRTIDQVKKAVLARMALDNFNENDSMKNLIKASLDNSVLTLAKDYSQQRPIIASLSLGVITQTLLSLSSFLSGYLTFFAIRFLEILGFCKEEKKEYLVSHFRSTEK